MHSKLKRVDCGNVAQENSPTFGCGDATALATFVPLDPDPDDPWVLSRLAQGSRIV